MRPRALTSSLLAAVLAAGVLAGATAAQQPSPDATAGRQTDLKNPDARQVRPLDELAPAAGGTFRVSAANRYETAVEVARFTGWDFSTTVAVYVASGQDYPDALAVGPSTLDLGPLLLVNRNGVPGPTRGFLEEVRPCFVIAVGGTQPIPDAVLEDLDQYTQPELCQP